MVENLVLHVT